MTQDSQNGLTADSFDSFKESLELLYILANISGRVNFLKKWPVAAQYILGETLIRYDMDGPDDREHRAELEVEAEERRLAFLALLDELEEKSVIKGALQTDYVAGLVQELGPELARLIYQEKIVERFANTAPAAEAPASAGAQEPVRVVAEEGSGYAAFYQKPTGMSEEEIRILEKKRQAASEEDFHPAFQDDPMDLIQPISVDITPAQPAPDIAQPHQGPAVDETHLPAAVDHVEAHAPVQAPLQEEALKETPMPPASPAVSVSAPAPVSAPVAAPVPAPDAPKEGYIASNKHVFEVPKVESVKPPPVINAPDVLKKPEGTEAEITASPSMAPGEAAFEAPAPASTTAPAAVEAPLESSAQKVTMTFVSSRKKEPLPSSDTGAAPPQTKE